MENLNLKSIIVPKPWIVESAVQVLQEYLEQHPQATLLEFGTGCSTAFFAQFKINQISIEHDPRWHSQVQHYLNQNNLTWVNLKLIKGSYYEACLDLQSNSVDLILVDGQHRLKCLEYGARILKSGGIIMLDDSQHEKYQVASQLFPDWQEYQASGEKPNPISGEIQTARATWWIKP